ncbi:glycine cleavage system protein R [Methylothermus subterraneus]
MQLIISALEVQESDLFERLIAAIQESACRILESRMTRLADGYACFMLAEGNWNHLARLENSLTGLQQRAQVFFKRLSESVDAQENSELLYIADIVARDRSGILLDLIRFFSDQGIVIQDLRSSCYQLPYVDSSVCTIHLMLRIPEEISVLSLRDEFLDFCEHLQVDAILEPVKLVF